MHGVAGSCESDGVLVIALERRPIVVEGIAVGLDDHFRLWPIEVDEVPIDQDVDLGKGQAGPLTEGEEVDLERRDGVPRAGVNASGHPPEAAEASTPIALFDDAVKLPPFEAPTPVSVDDHVLELPFVEPARTVHDRPLDRRDRNARLDGHVLIRQRTSLVEPDTVRPPVSGDAEHLVRAPRSPDAPELGRAAMGEVGARTAGKSRRHPLAIDADPPVSQGEDSSMQNQQLAILDSALDQSLVETQFDQLTPGHDSMLLLCQLAQNCGRRRFGCNVLWCRERRNTLHLAVGGLGVR